MNSLYEFIIKPIGERYNNEIKVKDKNLILNSSISNHKFIYIIETLNGTPMMNIALLNLS